MNRFIWTLVFVLIPFALQAATAPLDQRVVEHTFPNGIKLLILERHFSPTVAIRMMFRVGSTDEITGKTGLAHMFEHMMFKGTKTLGTKNYALEAPVLAEVDRLHRELNIEKDKGANANQTKISDLIDQIGAAESKAATFVVDNELWNLYEKEGASDLNAQTSHDYTQYVVDLPSNKLELWALLDSDRVRNPVFRQFYSEREVVKEERRMRVDTDASGRLFENFLQAAYAQHPYRHPTIGWENDIDHFTVGDLTDFYHLYYTPDRLTIAIVGDVQADAVIKMVDHYFGSWSVPSQVRPEPPQEPVQSGLRINRIKFDAQPQLVVGFHIPTYPDPIQPISFAISELLGSGTTSRLYKTLVEKDKLATDVSVGSDYPGERYGTLLAIEAKPRFPHTVAEVQSAIEKELRRLQTQPIADWEVEKVRSAVEVSILDQLQTNGGMAETLAYQQTIFGHWSHILEFQKRIETMTAKDIQAAAKTIFNPDNETVEMLETIKKPKAGAAK